MSASISEWRGDWHTLVFFAPIKLSNLSKVLHHHCPEYLSCSFYDPSVKHHLPEIVGTDAFTTDRAWSDLCAWLICASAQSTDSVSANLKISRGSIFKLIKTLLFFPFHIYHRIHAKWWSASCLKLKNLVISTKYLQLSEKYFLRTWKTCISLKSNY